VNSFKRLPNLIKILIHLSEYACEKKRMNTAIESARQKDELVREIAKRILQPEKLG